VSLFFSIGTFWATTAAIDARLTRLESDYENFREKTETIIRVESSLQNSNHAINGLVDQVRDLQKEIKELRRELQR
jgi:predicted transcriptional regulator